MNCIINLLLFYSLLCYLLVGWRIFGNMEKKPLSFGGIFMFTFAPYYVTKISILAARGLIGEKNL